MGINCNKLWERVRLIFETDDGSLPGIEITGLGGQQVVDVYSMVRCGAELCTTGASFWSKESQANCPVDSVSNPAELVVSGNAEPFHHCVRGLTIDGIELPELGIFVFADCIELDVRPGPCWGPREVEGLFRLLLAVLQKAPTAHVSLAQEVTEIETDLFRAAWDEYRSRQSSD